MGFRLIKIFAAFAILIGSTVLAAAKCEHPPIPWKFGKGAVNSVWTITDGSSCSSSSNRPQHIQDIEVVTKPKFGIAGRDGPNGVAYQPNPGFKGEDAFSYKVTSNADYRKGAGLTALVHVKVISR